MNMYSVRNWLAALSLVASLGLISTAVAQDTAATEKKDDTVTLEKFSVTGSRIMRRDIETPAPVVAYSAADIEAKGYTNIGDFIQSLPFNTGAANSIYQTASFLRGAATTNVRGLGSQRFLTLIDGRRAVPYALTNSGNRSVFDFNSLPAAAIDSVEFLKDGASAIYGSDAITGVLNIKLKKNYSGLSLSGYYGNTQGHDTGTQQVSLVAGSGTGKTRIMTALDFKSSNSNFLRDYDIKSTDYSASGRGINQNSSLNFPANITINAALGTQLGLPASGTLVVNGGTLLASPTLGDFSRVTAVTNVNRYDFVQTYQRYPAYFYNSAFTEIEHDINENLKAFAKFTYSDNFTFYAFTPGVINFPTEGLSLPANSPYNPFGIAVTTLLARTSFGPVRKFDTESLAANAIVGLKGTVMQKWDWEAAASYGMNRVTTISRNAIRASTFQSALNGTLTGFVGSFFNPFGPSSNPNLANALFTTSTASNRAENTTFDANVSGSLYDLPAGELGFAAGAEYRKEELVTNPDTAPYLGSGGGLPLTGRREVSSFYAEVTAPITKFLELQGAVRHERYSDFGNTTKPKIAAKVTLPKTKFASVLLRGSYSESFQAPALGLLYASQTIGFSSTVLQDPLRLQDPPQQQRIVTGGNPNLLPETAESNYYGVVVEDIGGIKNFSINVDYFKFRINQVIVTPSANFLLSEQGRIQFPNAIVRDGADGPITRIDSVPSNNPAALQIYRGFDVGVNYRLNNTRFGDYIFNAEATRILEIGSDSGLGGGYFDNVGLYNNPKWRGTASVSWRYKVYGASLGADYIGKYFNDGYTAAGWDEGAYTLFSGSFSYRGFLGATLTVGVNNLLDKLPPFNGYDTASFDPNTYGAGAMGRFIYVRVRKEF
ncbi:MAG: TonB-dependent receptor [Lacunisphaera sp.]|nr:TonB-dependent receptor [Lacunisphaera sp.]